MKWSLLPNPRCPARLLSSRFNPAHRGKLRLEGGNEAGEGWGGPGAAATSRSRDAGRDGSRLGAGSASQSQSPSPSLSWNPQQHQQLPGMGLGMFSSRASSTGITDSAFKAGADESSRECWSWIRRKISRKIPSFGFLGLWDDPSQTLGLTPGRWHQQPESSLEEKNPQTPQK